MKKYLLAIFAALVAAAGCNKIPTTEGEVTEVRLDRTKLTLTVGQSEKLTATVLPEGAAATIAWASTDTDVVTVSADGTVKALALGSATVTAKAGNQTAFCTVTVADGVVEKVTIDPAATQLEIGEKLQLNAVLEPAGIEQTVIWSSQDNAIVTVTQTGEITAVTKGRTTIIAKAGEQGGTCQVEVVGISVKSVTVAPATLTLDNGGTAKLEADVQPANADNRTVTWRSSDPQVALVDREGNITTYSPGTTTITATAGDKEGTCELTVNKVPMVGDIYFSDGTYDPAPVSGKTPVGVIFWIGDPSASDPTLKADHPECVNGLVVALTEDINAKWQSNFAAYNKRIDQWLAGSSFKNTYDVIGISNDQNTPSRVERAHKILGYNNTKVLEAFNADAANSSWPVDAIATLADYRTNKPVPEGTSGWYLPSTKELSLLCSGQVTNYWPDGEGGGTANCNRLNTTLGQIAGAKKLAQEGYPLYLSSSELETDVVARYLSAIYFVTGLNMPGIWYKAYGGLSSHSGQVRYVLAF